MSIKRRLRRTVFVAVLAPLAGRVAGRAASELEKRRGADSNTRRLRQAAAFLQGDGLKRYMR
ncbi:MAG: hypothetical protein ACR2J0_07225 [Mycobacteriales bacterium]